MSSPLVVSLSERLTVSTVEATHATLREALGGAGEIVLDVSQASEIDVAFLQLLVAAERSATQAGRSVQLSAPPSGVLAEALRRCGFAPAGAATALSEIFPS